MAGFDWASLLPFVTTISVALTVVVGIIGLRQGHYRKGRITKRGRTSVAVMIALGVVTLSSAFIGKEISDAKEKQDSSSRLDQFNRQMASMRGMTERLDRTQSALQDSLRRQEALAAATDRNLTLSRGLQQQAQANADRVIQRIAEDTNRFSLGDMSVNLWTQCPEDTALPQPDTYFLFMTVRGRRGLIHLQHPTFERGGNYLTFDRLEGDLENFDTFPPWETARVSFHFGAFAQAYRRQRREEQGDRWDPLGSQRFNARAPMRCPIGVSIHVKGRLLLDARGTLVEHAEGMFSARLRGIRPRLREPVDPSRLPFDL